MKLQSIIIYLALLPVSLSGIAAPLPDARQNEVLQAVCSGQGGLEGSSQKLLVYNTDGTVPAVQDDMEARYRAESAADYGLVLCLARTDQVLETCQYSVFFALPRIRINYRLQLRAASNPGTILYSTQLPGSQPAACNMAGVINSQQKYILGAPPDSASLLAVINDILKPSDEDGDGLDRLSEWLAGSDPQNALDPGAFARISTNSTAIAEGEALTILLDFNPGPLQGQLTDYRVWAETPAGLFSYVHPTGFVPVETAALSVRAKATRLDRFGLSTLPAIGPGNYRLHFEVEVGNELFSDTSNLTVTASDWHFTEISRAAGLVHVHGNFQSTADISLDRQYMAAGVAVADYDKDGWPDLFVTGGSAGSNLLYHNERNGTFRNATAEAGVGSSLLENSGATFADYDGDGWPDLLVSGINTTTRPLLYHNEANGTFTEVGTAAGLPFIVNSMGSSFADYDRDGDLDFWMTHWNASNQAKYLFRNEGGTRFTDVSKAAGIPDNVMADYTANFADINNDHWPDLLVAADFGTSRVFMNQGNGTFRDATTAAISDENGMGAAVADYDNDGDLDWFVSSIHDSRTADIGPTSLNWGKSGNRFYVNQGDGTFADLTDYTGTREGGWGWGACFADFNNDGFLDLFHVNGYASPAGITTAPFEQDPSRLFVSDQQGGFTERAVALGIADKGQGRGIACFDYDRDGDIDIYVANNRQAPLLYENRGLTRHWLEVDVAGEALNSAAIGARIYVTVDGTTQMRELNAGSNYMSQNPALAHFGLGSATRVEILRVVWPSGDVRELLDVAADQILTVTK